MNWGVSYNKKDIEKILLDYTRTQFVGCSRKFKVKVEVRELTDSEGWPTGEICGGVTFEEKEDEM